MPELAKKQFELFRELVEAHSKTITRRAAVDRNRALYEAVAATDRKPHLNEFLIKTMPTPTGDIEAIFINLGRNVDCNTLADELAAVGLELIVDPQGLVAINKDDPAFADDHPNGTQWKDTEGRYCFMSFYRGGGRRRVRLGQDDRPWRDLWWFPCRRLYS